MDSNDKKIKKKLIAKRKIIKNKLDLLKHGLIKQEKKFFPITKHLLNIENKLEDSSNKRTKNEIERDLNNSYYSDQDEAPQHTSSNKKHDDDDYKILAEETPQRKRKREPSSSFDNKLSILEEALSEEELADKHEKDTFAESTTETSFDDYLEQYDPLPRKYIRDMIHDDNKEFDHKYGVRHNPITEKFYVGDSELNINGSDIIIQGKRYKGTRGLYELLFKKHPSNYTKDDETIYKQIVLKTNAARRYYKSTNQIDGSRLEKYKNIIAPTISGNGLFMEITRNPVDYVHWDDPNELVDRLRLLIASQHAGHTGHTNEINSIIEELHEARIISR